MFESFNRYADFAGRSARTEYWLFQLLNWSVWAIGFGVIISGIDFTTDLELALQRAVGGPAFIVGVTILVFWTLISIVPAIAVTVRRLHDRDMSGWWMVGFPLLSMIPFLGWIANIAYFVILCMDGTPGDNRYGPDPKGRGWGAVAFA